MKPTRKLPSLKYLNECFALDETSPSRLTWKVRPPSHFPPAVAGKGNERNRWNSRYANSPAGYLEAAGNTKNFCVKIDGNKWRVHRILYSLYHQKLVPENRDIDHIDGDGTNNSPGNLRVATESQNLCNSKLFKNNTSGIKGVVWNPAGKVWVGQVRYRCKTHYLGRSKSKEQIGETVRKFRNKIHREFANHG